VQQLITVPQVGETDNNFTATQKYYYDSLNRIDDATETVSSQTWRQDFSYDRYGNRNFVEANTTFTGFDKLCNGNTELCSTLRKQLNPGINSSNNNRINSGQDYTYDAAGNTLTDANSQSYIYDAENKQVKASNGGGTLGEYFYDGDGKRVKKVVPGTGEVTIFVYDAAGKQIAEYSTNVADEGDAKVAYLTTDHLGSPRINTDSTATVTSRHDYHPFGEEITTTARSNHPDYTPDTVRKQFTGYERDTETSLDLTGARYYRKDIGRFLSVDPILIDYSRTIDPQRINGYVYVRNNPLKYVDPDGMDLKLAAGMKKSDQDRIIKHAIKLYRKESGRKALEQLDKSKTTYEIRNGKLDTTTNPDGSKTAVFGRTEPDSANFKMKTDPSGKATSIDTTNVTVGVTLDLAKFDQTLRDIGADKLPLGSLPSESGVFNEEVGHALDFDNDPVQFQNQREDEGHAKSDKFIEKVKKEKDTVTEAKAEEEVRKLLGLPPKESKDKNKPKPKTEE